MKLKNIPVSIKILVLLLLSGIFQSYIIARFADRKRVIDYRSRRFYYRLCHIY